MKALEDGKHHRMEEKICIDGFMEEKWKGVMNYYERHFLSLKKFEGVCVIYFTELEKMNNSN